VIYSATVPLSWYCLGSQSTIHLATRFSVAKYASVLEELIFAVAGDLVITLTLLQHHPAVNFNYLLKSG
jgi:hypothetical protein